MYFASGLFSFSRYSVAAGHRFVDFVEFVAEHDKVVDFVEVAARCSAVVC